MRRTPALTTTAALAAALSAAPALADRLVIEHVVGQVTIETGAFDAISVEVSSQSGDAPIVTREGDEVRIDGGLPNADCNTTLFGRPRAGGRQTVTVQAPRDVELTLLARRADIVAGDVASVSARLDGCGEWTLGSVAGDATIANNGVGRIALGDIGGRAELSLNGTGRIQAGDIAGGGSLEVNGTGRVTVTAITGRTDVDVNGTGRVSIATLNGEFSGQVNGTGDIRIRGGRAPVFVGSANGPAADIRFDGVAGDAFLDANGFAGITIARVEGQLRRDANLASIRIRERR